MGHVGRLRPHHGCSVALGYVPVGLSDPAAASEIEIEIIGDLRRATVQPAPLFDPQGHRMRA